MVGLQPWIKATKGKITLGWIIIQLSGIKMRKIPILYVHILYKAFFFYNVYLSIYYTYYFYASQAFTLPFLHDLFNDGSQFSLIVWSVVSF